MSLLGAPNYLTEEEAEDERLDAEQRDREADALLRREDEAGEYVDEIPRERDVDTDDPCH